MIRMGPGVDTRAMWGMSTTSGQVLGYGMGVVFLGTVCPLGMMAQPLYHCSDMRMAPEAEDWYGSKTRAPRPAVFSESETSRRLQPRAGNRSAQSAPVSREDRVIGTAPEAFLRAEWRLAVI